MTQSILQNQNPPGPVDQNVPVTGGSSSQVHTPGTDKPGTLTAQGNLDLVAIGAGFGFVAERGTSAEGGPLIPIDTGELTFGSATLRIKNPV
jgi:hypothetical protein